MTLDWDDKTVAPFPSTYEMPRIVDAGRVEEIFLGSFGADNTLEIGTCVQVPGMAW